MQKRKNQKHCKKIAAASDVPELLRTLRITECRLFHTQDGEPYIDVHEPQPRVVVNLKSDRARAWLDGLHVKTHGAAARTGDLDLQLRTLQGLATSGPKRQVWRRVAKKNDDVFYIDLADEKGRVIRVDASGWRVLKRSGIAFERSSSMAPLPKPERGGSIEDLWQHLNVPSSSRSLVLAWLLECFRPHTPYAGLLLAGPSGSAKSFTLNCLRDLVDPTVEARRTKAKTLDDIFVAAANSHVVSYENLSDLSGSAQDAFCTILTGGGYAKRRHYSNAQETLLSVKRPVLINGISKVVTRPDLLERFVTIEMKEIPASVRREESAMQAAFDAAKPKLFGALLDLFSGALRYLPKVRKEEPELPRMADFALLGEAAARASGKKPGSFFDRYATMARRQVAVVVNETALGAALVEIVKTTGKVSGTFVEIVAQVRSSDAYKCASDRTLPKTGRGFGDELRRLTPALSQIGATVTNRHSKNGTIWTIKRVA